MKVYIEFLNGGEKYPIEIGSTTVGRKGADIPAIHELVSGKHLELSFNGARLILRDLNSTNGTFVSKEQIKRKTLKNGDIISLGSSNYDDTISFKIVIEGDNVRTVYKISNRVKWNKPVMFIIFTLLLLIMIGIFWDSEETTAEKVIKTVEEVEQSRVYDFKDGTKINIIYACSVNLPSSFKWLLDNSYEQSPIKSDIYSDTIGITKLENKNTDNFEEINLNASVSFQKFKDNFIGDIEKLSLNNFVWHAEVFLKENKINSNFVYRKTKTGIWQWVMWFDGESFNLYANNVNGFSRVIFQANSNNAKFLTSFFIDFIDSLWCKS